MKKKFRVVQINGFRGLAVMLFVAACLIAGFVAFPGLVAMFLWNFLSVKTANSIPLINLGQGLLLWAIVALSYFMFTSKKKLIISFDTDRTLTDDEMKDVMDKIKKQNFNEVKITDFIENKKEQNSLNNKMDSEEKVKSCSDDKE